MTKYICIKEISYIKLIEYNTNYTVTYKSPVIDKYYFVDRSSRIFGKDNNLTEDYHNFIFEGDHWLCTIPEKDLYLYLVSVSEHRDKQINEILGD